MRELSESRDECAERLEESKAELERIRSTRAYRFGAAVKRAATLARPRMSIGIELLADPADAELAGVARGERRACWSRSGIARSDGRLPRVRWLDRSAARGRGPARRS